uniref:Uncharacterized protein n=1 Tax=Aegilops tauschii TaxID=37682 RepID=M8BTU5_AEGTA
MASKSVSLLVLAALVAAACLAGLGSAARDMPAEKPAEDAVKRPETFQEGTVLIPGIGRIPAAASGQFIPGADDTWVPNPGFEIPNPFRPGSESP